MHQPILGCDIVQVAYHVADIEQSAKWAAKTLGAGPFVVSRDIELSESIHRGALPLRAQLRLRPMGQDHAGTGAAGIEWCISFSGFIQRGRTGPAPRGHDGR